jgi:hypothetical protein
VYEEPAITLLEEMPITEPEAVCPGETGRAWNEPVGTLEDEEDEEELAEPPEI